MKPHDWETLSLLCMLWGMIVGIGVGWWDYAHKKQGV